MPEIDLEELPDDPTPADMVRLLKRYHDCGELRFDGIERRLEEIAAQVSTDRGAAKSREAARDSEFAKLKKAVGTLRKTQLAVRGQIGVVATGQAAINGHVAAAAEKADTAAAAAGKVGDRVEAIAGAIGAPTDKPGGASVFSKLTELTAEISRANDRIRRADVFWDRARVAIATAVPILGASGWLIWWLVGPQVAAALRLPVH